jgi:hypothetical protein
VKLSVLVASITLVSIPAAISAPLSAGALGALSRAVGACSDPCVVQSNHGGRVVDFEDAADAIRAGARKQVIIDGYCASSCMVMADRARARVCITSRAVFAYHKTNFNRPIPLRSDLRRWIMRSGGGFPAFHATPGIMPNHVAQRFWRRCPSDQQRYAGFI